MTDEAAPGPSARAVQRLASDVGGEVADLRTRLHRALDEAGRLEAEGRQDLAAAVLEEQRQALLSVHQRLQGRLADAAVEREAERVVAESTPLVGATTASPATSGSPDAAAPDGSASTAVRLLAAVAAAAMGFVLLVAPEVGEGVLTMAGWTSAAEPEPGEAASTDPVGPSSARQTPPTAGEGSAPTEDAQQPVVPEPTPPVRSDVDGDRPDRGEESPSSPSPDQAAPGTNDLGGLAHHVQEWLDGLIRTDEADDGAHDGEPDADRPDEAPSVLPIERGEDPDSDDERVLGER